MSDTVLVTGGFGLVGSATVRRLAAAGRRVVASDLDTAANRKAAAVLPPNVVTRWADLTDTRDVAHLVSDVAPAAIVHLAAIIPPQVYRNAILARRVNVDATAALASAAERQRQPPRFLFASSNAVYGARNPHRVNDLLRSDSPLRPADLYGAHKAHAEKCIRSSNLEWVILRLGGVFSVDVAAMGLDLDGLFFANALPYDGRMHSVDVRDVASAFAAAITADVAGETFLIGGDESHHLRQGDANAALAAAVGLPGVLPSGRPGNPNDDDNWFATDWMDTTQAQQALSFQHHSWPEMLAEIRSRVGWKRHPMRLVAPLARWFLESRSPYHRISGRYAEPWAAIRTKFGDSLPDIGAA